MTDRSAQQDINEMLGEPVLPDFRENTYRIRRNLLAVSAIAIFLKYFDITVDQARSNGFVFDNLSPEAIFTALFIIIAYELIHFWVETIDYRQQLGLRLSGKKIAHVAGTLILDKNIEYTKDPKQVNLYLWWRCRSKQLKDWEELLEELKGNLDRMPSAVHPLPMDHAHSINRHIQENLDTLNKISEDFKENKEIFESNHIQNRLSRFNDFYKNFEWQQRLRLGVIEWLLPIALGVFALFYILLSTSFFS